MNIVETLTVYIRPSVGWLHYPIEWDGKNFFYSYEILKIYFLFIVKYPVESD
jgi:hypothetical protein